MQRVGLFNAREWRFMMLQRSLIGNSY